MCTICVQVLMDPIRGLRSPKTGVRDGCEPSDVGAGTELGSSPKKDVLVSFLINPRQDSHLRRTTNDILPPQGCL